MDKLLKQEKNFNSICHSCVSENPAENKVLHTAGSSGSADAAPRMTECGESGRSTPICHCETAQTKNNPANCFCAQSNETQKAKRQCGRIDVEIEIHTPLEEQGEIKRGF